MGKKKQREREQEISTRELAKRARRLGREAKKVLRRSRRKLAPEEWGRFDADVRALSAVVRRAEVDRGELEGLSDRISAALEGPLAQFRPSAAREYVSSILWAVVIALFIRAFFFEAFQIPTGSMIPTLRIGDHLFVNKFIYGVRIPWTRLRFFDWRQPRRGEVIVFEYPGQGPEQGKDFIKRVVAVPGDRVRIEGYTLYVNGEPQFGLAVAPNVHRREGRVADGVASLLGDLIGPPHVWRRMACNDAENDPCDCQVRYERLGDHSYITQHHVPPCVGAPNWPQASPACSPFLPGDCMYFGAKATNQDWPEVVVPEGFVLCIGDNRDNSSDGRFWGLVPQANIRGKAFVIWWARDWSRMFSLVH
jgi:signal peptidase I